VFWQNIPYSLGGFTPSGADADDRLATLVKPDHRIYLGCAAVSGNGGWMEGAVAAAWRQVKAFHERVMTDRQPA
jgi:monoamine oxidase